MSGSPELTRGHTPFSESVLQRKDFWSAVVYVGLGVGTIIVSRRYDFGSPSNMGPGFFPIILSSILVLIGSIIGIRVFVAGDAGPEVRLGIINWKALALITAATVAFGVLLPYAGVLIALPVLMMIGAAASRHFRLELRALLGMLLLSTATVLIFVIGLGVPMPILGSLFRG